MAGDTDSANESSLTREEDAGEVAETTTQADASAADGADSGDGRQCMPCRGTGKLISNLAGTASTVTCPWCGGTGVRQAGVDAQQRFRDQDAAESATADAADAS
jgi:DnaJ-class molecular chaperone